MSTTNFKNIFHVFIVIRHWLPFYELQIINLFQSIYQTYLSCNKCFIRTNDVFPAMNAIFCQLVKQRAKTWISQMPNKILSISMWKRYSMVFRNNVKFSNVSLHFYVLYKIDNKSQKLLRLIAQMKLVLPNSTIHNICHFAVIRWIITGKRLILFLYTGYINLECMYLALRILRLAW